MSERLELAAKAAFDKHIVDSMARGKFIAGNWAAADDATKYAWRSVAQAAVDAWNTAPSDAPA